MTIKNILRCRCRHSLPIPVAGPVSRRRSYHSIRVDLQTSSPVLIWKWNEILDVNRRLGCPLIAMYSQYFCHTQLDSCDILFEQIEKAIGQLPNSRIRRIAVLLVGGSFDRCARGHVIRSSAWFKRRDKLSIKSKYSMLQKKNIHRFTCYPCSGIYLFVPVTAASIYLASAVK